MFFDTHLHMIYLGRLNYPWLGEVSALNQSSTLENYMTKARRLGITDSLHMEVDVADAQIRDETSLISELMRVENSPLRGAISACRPERDDFSEFLDWAQEMPQIKGFRRVLHVVPDAVSQTTTFRENIRRLSNTRFTYDLCVSSNQLDLAIQLVDFCPQVRFILDHCGVPDIKSGEMQPWAKDMRELAKRPNVTVKISGIIAYGDLDHWGLDDIRPWFEHTVSAFGHDRIIWGSDSPVCNLGGGLETWVAVTHALTHGWSLNDRDALYRNNALSIWPI